MHSRLYNISIQNESVVHTHTHNIYTQETSAGDAHVLQTCAKLPKKYQKYTNKCINYDYINYPIQNTQTETIRNNQMKRSLHFDVRQYRT